MTDEEKASLAHKLAKDAVSGILGVFGPTERAEGRQVLDMLIAQLQAVVKQDDKMNEERKS